MKTNRAIYENLGVVSGYASRLYRVSDAARMLGLTSLGDDLEDIASGLEASAKQVRDAYGEELSDGLAESQRQMALTLKALIGASS